MHLTKKKRCPKCSRVKLRKSFNKDSTRYDGLQTYCRNCQKAINKLRARTDGRKRTQDRYDTGKGRFTSAKWRALKQRRITWTISKKEYDKLLGQKCFYCGGKLSKSGVGLDRIDNKKGYTINNVVPCCGLCNSTRSNRFTVEQMKQIGKLIKKWRNNGLLD